MFTKIVIFYHKKLIWYLFIINLVFIFKYNATTSSPITGWPLTVPMIYETANMHIYIYTYICIWTLRSTPVVVITPSPIYFNIFTANALSITELLGPVAAESIFGIPAPSLDTFRAGETVTSDIHVVGTS